MRSRLPSQIIVPLIVACALFMQNLDSTVIATALPAISRSLHEDPLRLNLAITSYLLSLAVFIPLSGWMADRFGARTVFCCAIAVFTLGSAGCGLAENLPELERDDLVYSEKIGAYSHASATYFNGFPPAKVVHVNM